MPAVAVAVAAAAASSAASSLAIGGALFSAGFLGSFGAAVVADSIFSAVVGFGVQKIGGALLGQTGKKKSSNLGGELQSGLKQTVRLSDDSYKLIYGKARISGTLAYAESTNSAPDSDGITQSGDNLFLHMVIIHAGHEVDGFETLYLNDDVVTIDGNGFVNEAPYKKDGKSYVRIKHHLGSDSQVADSTLVAEASNWTTNHRLRGLAYTYIRLQWNADVFTSGIPTFNAVIRGKKVYDPRTATTVWSDNAALCIRDYLTSRDSANVPYGFGATSDEIDDTFTTAAANICEETITKLDASTIDRYTINGVIDTSASPIDNLEQLLTALAGVVTYPTGKFRIYAGAFDTPETDVIDESWLAGDLESQDRIARQDLFNAVRGTFINPAKGWQKDDFPALTSTTYETQDNGERIYTDVELPYTIDGEAAQRIAKIAQRKGREQISVTMRCNYKALKFTVWDVVKLSNDIQGWTEKLFRVTGFSFDIRGGVTLELREENEDSYDWTASDAEAVASAPDTNLPSAFSVAVPSNVAYDSRSTGTVGGDEVFNLVLTWDSHSNAFVRGGGQFEIQFKESSETDWRPSFFVDGSLTTSDIVSNSVNVSYDLRIRAMNMLGVKSNWVTIENAIIGSGGGVGATLDWGDWTTSATAFNDWGDWTTTPTGFNDWGDF